MTGATGGNVRLRAARESLGLSSQADFVDALNTTAVELGIGDLSVTTRTIRRWESATPPWPHRPHIQVLEALFTRPIEDLGFTPRRRNSDATPPPLGPTPPSRVPTTQPAARHLLRAPLPHTVTAEYEALTAIYRRLYWSVPAPILQPTLSRHAELGMTLLSAVPGDQRARFAAAAAESWLLVGRIQFFDLQEPESSKHSFVCALECAHEAGDHEIAAAILAHMAFEPAFTGDPSRATASREKMRMARTFLRRAGDPAILSAWLDAVESEVETRLGNPDRALSLVARAEQTYSATADTPAWLDWFSIDRLGALKANTLLAAGRSVEARVTLEGVLRELPADAVKQRAVVYCDLAAVAALTREPDKACQMLTKALDEMGVDWYGGIADRIKIVRNTLEEWAPTAAVRALDERVYDWSATISAVS